MLTEDDVINFERAVDTEVLIRRSSFSINEVLDSAGLGIDTSLERLTANMCVQDVI